MSNFDMALLVVLKNEGGLSHDTNDPGGTTNMGISLRLLKSCGLKYDFDQNGIVDEREITNLTPDQARLVYGEEFWSQAQFEKINYQLVCNYIFDSAINMGIQSAIKIAQRAVRAITLSFNIEDDGILGNKTLDEINYTGALLLAPMRAERANKYRQLVIENPKLQSELNGWLRRAYAL
jgi:lysozyme family protein